MGVDSCGSTSAATVGARAATSKIVVTTVTERGLTNCLSHS